MLLETISAFGVATSRQKAFVYTKFLAAAILQCSTFQVFPTVFSYLLTPNAWLSGRDRLSQSPLPIHYIRSSTEQSQFLSFSITRRSVEGEFHLKKSLSFTHRRSDIVLFRYFIPALGFSVILLFLCLTFLKIINFQKRLINQEQHHEWPFEKEVKYLSRVATER